MDFLVDNATVVTVIAIVVIVLVALAVAGDRRPEAVAGGARG